MENRLVGLVVKAPTSRAEDPGFKSRLRRDFSGSSHTSYYFLNGTPVATLPCAWRYGVSAGTVGRRSVSEIHEHVARRLEADPSLETLEHVARRLWRQIRL